VGTTRIKVIDLSGGEEQLKTSRKRAERGLKPVEAEKLKAAKGPKKPKVKEEEAKVEIKPEAEEQRTEVAVDKKVTTVPIPIRKKIRSRRYLEAKRLIEKDKLYPLDQALELAKKVSVSRFDGSLEIHLVVQNQNLRGLLKLPHPFAKKAQKLPKTLVFTTKVDGLDEKDEIILGNQSTIEKIREGQFVPRRDFQKVLATPDFMPQLAKIAKTLGPVGLMPNPKSGTLVEDVGKALKEQKAGQIEYKTEAKAPIIHLAVGRLSQNPKELAENILALATAIGQNQIKTVYLSPTMGPSIKVDPTTLAS